MLFLLLVVVGSALGIAIVLVRNRRPTSMDASIESFERSLRALAPEPSEPDARERDARERDARRTADDDGAQHPG